MDMKIDMGPVLGKVEIMSVKDKVRNFLHLFSYHTMTTFDASEEKAF